MKSEDILYEMSNFNSNTTGLPANIEVWAKTDPNDYGHSRYQIKIRKDKEWAAIYTVGAKPQKVKDINRSLSLCEENMIISFVITYSSLLIGLIDNKIDSGEFANEVKKLRAG